MAYDWSEPLPGCDGCGESDEESEWYDTEDFWGHAACWPAVKLFEIQAELAYQDMKEGRGEFELVRLN